MAGIVKLKTCSNAFEAQLLKSRLEDAGIPSIVADENISMLYAGAVGAFAPRVLVREEDFEAALQLIEEKTE